MAALDAINNLPPLREVISTHDLRAEKKLGQNFLLDLNLTRKIARAAEDRIGHTVFEIGPGPGGLTRGLLLEGAEKLIALEYDVRAIAALEGLVQASAGRLQVHHQDALEADLLTLAPEGPRAIVANLPYNIATPLLVNWLRQICENEGAYSSMTLMFQKEVAERICAAPGSKAYGRLAVLASWLCDCRLLFDVPASAFTPAPKVTSSIAQLLTKKLERDQPAFATVEALTAAAFGQRRKMIRSSLKHYAGAISICGLDDTLRAENLTKDDFIALARAVEGL